MLKKNVQYRARVRIQICGDIILQYNIGFIIICFIHCVYINLVKYNIMTSGSVKTAGFSTFSDMISTQTIAKLNALSRGQGSNKSSLSKSNSLGNKSSNGDSSSSSSEESSDDDDRDLVKRAKKARALKRKREADEAAEAKANKKPKTTTTTKDGKTKNGSDKEKKERKGKKETKEKKNKEKTSGNQDKDSVKKTESNVKDKGKSKDAKKTKEERKVRKPKKPKETPIARKQEDLLHSSKTLQDVQKEALDSKSKSSCKTLFTIDSELKDVQDHARAMLKRQTWKSDWPLDLRAEVYRFPQQKIVVRLYFEIDKEFKLTDKNTQTDLDTIAVMFGRYVGIVFQFTMPGIGVIFHQHGWAWTETLERLIW